VTDTTSTRSEETPARTASQPAQVDPATSSIARLFDLTGRSAVVTGGAVGIGFGIARRLAEAGAKVLVADLDGAAAEGAAATLRGEGRVAQAVAVDVRSAADVERMVETAVAAHGRLDVLVNNAGIYPFMPVLAMTEELWDRVLDVNLKGTFLCAQAAAKQMVAQGGGGVIVNIASIDAYHPSSVGLAHYDASKGGVVMFTKNLALELGPHRIRVVAIAPGSVTTPGTRAATAAMGPIDVEAMNRAFLARIPLGRTGTPDDIGRVALFLASDAAAYITGSTVFVDGGVLLS